jgi:hypothetical protein
MKKILVIFAVLAMTAAAWAAPAERYLHVRVDDPAKQQSVHINLPLSVAAKMLPGIDHGSLHDGQIRVGSIDVNGVDVVQMLDALKGAPDGEYVSIQQRDRLVRVAKQNGLLIVHVEKRAGEDKKVDISVPWTVAAALVSSGKSHELNVEAAIQALENTGDKTEVSVTSNRQSVRIWVDSQSQVQ